MAREKTSKSVASKAAWIMSAEADTSIYAIKSELPKGKMRDLLTKYHKAAKSAAASALTQYEPAGDMKPGSKVANLARDISDALHDYRLTGPSQLNRIKGILENHGWRESV